MCVFIWLVLEKWYVLFLSIVLLFFAWSLTNWGLLTFYWIQEQRCIYRKSCWLWVYLFDLFLGKGYASVAFANIFNYLLICLFFYFKPCKLRTSYIFVGFRSRGAFTGSQVDCECIYLTYRKEICMCCFCRYFCLFIYLYIHLL